MENNEDDYKQIAFKLQSDIEHLRWENAQRDLAFLSEIRKRAVKAYNNRDVSEHEMLLKMIDDWIHELNQVP